MKLITMFQLFITFTFAIPATLDAMQTESKIMTNQPVLAWELIEPTQTENFLHQITVKDNDLVAGNVTYKPLNYKNRWRLCHLWVHPHYRNNKLGFKLFKQCIENVIKQGCKTLMWQTLPEEPHCTLDELVTIYRKMVKKVAQTYPCKLVTSDYYGTGLCQTAEMALTFMTQ